MTLLSKIYLIWIFVAFLMALITAFRAADRMKEMRIQRHFIHWLLAPAIFMLGVISILIYRCFVAIHLKKELIDLIASLYVDLFP